MFAAILPRNPPSLRSVDLVKSRLNSKTCWNDQIANASKLFYEPILQKSGSVHGLAQSDRVSNYSLKDNVAGNNNLHDVHARTMLPEGRVYTRSQLCSGVLTLYENTHIPTAKVDVIGNLTPVNARVIPMEGSQEEQGAVYYFHPFWHFTVQSKAQVR